MENVANFYNCFLMIIGKSNSDCKQIVNSEFFFKILLIYEKKYDILTKLDALTAEVAARVAKCYSAQVILPEYVRINRAKRRDRISTPSVMSGFFIAGGLNRLGIRFYDGWTGNAWRRVRCRRRTYYNKEEKSSGS